MSKVKKILLVICTILVTIVILTLTISFIVYPSEYVVRVFTWLSADVYDYKRFPERPIKTSAESYHFAYALAKPVFAICLKRIIASASLSHS